MLHCLIRESEKRVNLGRQYDFDTLFPLACEAMETQLQRLGKKWAAICTWTEQQWLVLQDLLLKWQNFSEEQAKFSDWLAEKEGILGTMMESDLTDPDTVIKQVKDLKVGLNREKEERKVLHNLRYIDSVIFSQMLSLASLYI